MKPIGPLMREHRVIERMVALFNVELDRINRTSKAQPDFITAAVVKMINNAGIFVRKIGQNSRDIIVSPGFIVLVYIHASQIVVVDRV